MRRMMLLIAFCAIGVLTFAPAATAQSGVQGNEYPKVYEDGSVGLSFDVGTDCRTIFIQAERGELGSLTQEESQSVLEECRSLGFLSSGTQYAPNTGGEDVSELPETGGPSGLALLGGALLLGSGLVIRRIVR